MSLKILADENISYRMVTLLRNHGYHVVWIMEGQRGLTDHEIIEVCRKENAVLLTEDSDFGEWVFAHKKKGFSVLFLRYNQNDLEDIYKALLNVLEKYKDNILRKFIVITKIKYGFGIYFKTK